MVANSSPSDPTPLTPGMGSIGQNSTFSEHGSWSSCISNYRESSALVLFVTSAMKIISFTISRCILEILNCALYLCRQGGDFGAGSVISILTTCDFSLNKHPLVKQALVNSQQEGKANKCSLVQQASANSHKHPVVKNALVNSQNEGKVNRHTLVKQASVNSQQEGKVNKHLLVKQAPLNSLKLPLVKMPW